MYRVVLVDDERLIIRGLSTVVPWEKLGCEVVGAAYNGESGLELIRKEKPDIVLSDIRMPNMDGLTMLAALKSEFPHMQMSVLTSYRDFDYAQQAINLGVCRYLLKPSKMDELEEAILLMTARLDAIKPQEEESSGGDGTAAGNYIVHRALEYMQEHAMEPHLSLNDVAEHVYVSQWHLSKLLNRETGQSFFDLLGGMKIECAKQMLNDPSLKIYEVAEQTGFADVAHFSKSFKKIAGCTPGEYRKGKNVKQ